MVHRRLVCPGDGESRTEGALAALRIATPYEMAVPGSWFGFYGNLYPVYVRGLAYLRSKRGGARSSGGRGGSRSPFFSLLTTHWLTASARELRF